jgi:hypothetical protein
MVDTISIYRTFEQIEVIQHWEKPPVMVDIHYRKTVRELTDWQYENGEAFINGLAVLRGQPKWNDVSHGHTMQSFVFTGSDGLNHEVSPDTEVIISYKEPGTWRRLTDEARATLIEVATDNESVIAEAFCKYPEMVEPLVGAGFINSMDEYWYYLTYAGASIIPPQLVKKEVSS